MAIVVNTNLSSLKTQNNLNASTNALGVSLERMSTGYKINSAKDDAAGLYVATGLETQIRGSKVAQDNIEVLQTVESDLDNILDNLNRIRDLASQAANSVYDEDAMNAMAEEVQSRIAEIERVSLASNFNGLELLSGNGTLSTQGLRLQVGANAGAAANSITIPGAIFSEINADTLGAGAATNAGSTVTGTDTVATGAEKAFLAATAAASYIAVLDKAIDTISSNKSTIGAVMNRLDAAAESLVTTIENTTAAKSTIMDADIAEESAEYTRQRILQQTSATLLVQANSLPSIALTLVTA